MSSEKSAPPTKVQQVSQKIEETKTEIQKSLQELANRGKKLEELEEQTAMLQDSSSVFKTHTTKVRKKKCGGKILR